MDGYHTSAWQLVQVEHSEHASFGGAWGGSNCPQTVMHDITKTIKSQEVQIFSGHHHLTLTAS